MGSAWPRMEPASPALAGGFFTTEPPGKPRVRISSSILDPWVNRSMGELGISAFCCSHNTSSATAIYYPVCVSHLVVSDSLQTQGVQSTRLLHPWDFPSKNTGVGCHSLLQGIFLTQGSNLGLLHCRQTVYHQSHQGSYIYYPSHLQIRSMSAAWLRWAFCNDSHKTEIKVLEGLHSLTEALGLNLPPSSFRTLAKFISTHS